VSTSNTLLGFTHFEREIIGNRFRGKVAASRKRGIRMDGDDAQNRKQLVNVAEATSVRPIFERFVELNRAGFAGGRFCLATVSLTQSKASISDDFYIRR